MAVSRCCSSLQPRSIQLDLTLLAYSKSPFQNASKLCRGWCCQGSERRILQCRAGEGASEGRDGGASSPASCATASLKQERSVGSKACRSGRWRHRVSAVPGHQDDKPNEYIKVQGVKYRPPGTTEFLLHDINLSLPEKSLGLIYGRSGSGKTTLLQLLAGLAVPTEGLITVGTETFDATKKSSEQGSLSGKAGIVFQFPERYFLTDSILEELVFGWPRRTNDEELRMMLSFRIQTAVSAVGLAGMPWDKNPRSLSDGYKRRLALAVQLVRMPDLLLLDEPLAGLDWMARAEVVKLLASLKQSQTLIVVSHDLKELTPLVDRAWEMEMGGHLREQAWAQ